MSLYLGYGAGTVTRANDVSAEIDYSKVRFSDIKDANFVSKYSTINIEKSNDIKADSKYDRFDIDQVRDFKCSSKYGNIEIAQAQNVYALSKYTDFFVENIKSNIDFDLQYGSVKIENILKGFGEVRLVGKYTDYKINVQDGASYHLEAIADYAGIKYPSNLNVTFEKDKGTYHEVEGHLGTANASSFIKARLDYGGLRVQ